MWYMADPNMGIRYYALCVKIAHSIDGILTRESEVPIESFVIPLLPNLYADYS